MSNETIFVTQLASVLAFVVTLFVLYRVLVSQKDATIELLREQVSMLKEQLASARDESPDIVAKRLSDRVNVLTDELARLHQDKSADGVKIEAKEAELDTAQKELAGLKEQLEYAQEIAAEYFCPTCKAPMTVREFHSELVEFAGRELDVDHEFVAFECGLSVADGKETHPCPEAPLPATEQIVGPERR